MTLRPPCFFFTVATAWLTIVVPVVASDLEKPRETKGLQTLNHKSICVAQLSPAFNRLATRPSLQRARVGVLVRPLQSKQALYAREAGQLFLPASTTKVLTTAAALTALGPDYRIQTSVYGAGKAPTLNSVKIVGRGDPNFSDKDLKDIAQTLSQKGVRRIRTLVGDDTFFKGAAVVPSWEWEDLQAGWGAVVNSLMVNENAYEVRLYPQAVGQPLRLEWQLHEPTIPWRLINRSRTVTNQEPEFTEIVRRLNQGVLEIEVFGQLRAGGDSDRSWIAVVDPGQYFLRRFQAQLQSEGIKVDKITLISEASQEIASDAASEVLATVESPPLSELIYTINRDSNNQYAEAVLKTLASQKPSNSTAQTNTPTLDQGLQVLKETLTKLGVDPATYEISDGSGLSRHNLVSPEALVQTLQAMDRSPHAEVFRNSLRPRELKGLPPGMVLTKTGSMTGVSALSGYIRGADFAPLAFSIFVNQYNQSRSELNPLLDDMVMLLARLKNCSS
ncbi:MAG: D-alanyl-D-alanine carboxypeptidase/D-alanyl-D-alanine-endopeptidase [Thermosynechococcaceae cyanobacterium]